MTGSPIDDEKPMEIRLPSARRWLMPASPGRTSWFHLARIWRAVCSRRKAWGVGSSMPLRLTNSGSPVISRKRVRL